MTLENGIKEVLKKHKAYWKNTILWNKNSIKSNKKLVQIFKMTKTILITGGSGYVGTRLILRLLNETNYKIVNYDISLFGDTHLPKFKINIL